MLRVNRSIGLPFDLLPRRRVDNRHFANATEIATACRAPRPPLASGHIPPQASLP
jgi:hypothetical protein